MTSKDLKSNMDRFIVLFLLMITNYLFNLKSNMDRFIVDNIDELFIDDWI